MNDTGEVAHELYTDGGVITVNPSPHGGTIAWCRVKDGVVVQEHCAIVRPADIGATVITNNNTELLALLAGICNLPDGWAGRVNSDSQVALGWVFSGWSDAKVPTAIRPRLRLLRGSGRLAGLQWRLLQGHPTRADLACGMGKKRALPVSEFNARCDRACAEAAKRFVAETNAAGPAGATASRDDCAESGLAAEERGQDGDGTRQGEGRA